MARKFIPEKDSEFLAMAKGFANGLAANPYAWFMAASEIEMVGRVVGDFEAAWLAATNPSTRTSSAINLKNQTRHSATQVIRGYANQIRQSGGISDQNKINIGILLRKAGLSKRHCPQTQPLLRFINADTGRHGLEYCDSTTPDSRAKPFAAHALQLFMALSDYGSPPVRDPEQARYVGEYGRNRIIVNHEFKDAGKTAVYFARWVGARNEHGPWSLPLTVQVMFAGSPESPEASVESSQQSEQQMKAKRDERKMKLAA